MTERAQELANKTTPSKQKCAHFSYAKVNQEKWGSQRATTPMGHGRAPKYHWRDYDHWISLGKKYQLDATAWINVGTEFFEENEQKLAEFFEGIDMQEQ